MSEIKHTMPNVIYVDYCTPVDLTWGGWSIKPMPHISPNTSYTRTDIYATATGELKAKLEQVKQSHAELLAAIESVKVEFERLKDAVLHNDKLTLMDRLRDATYLDAVLAVIESKTQQALNKANKSLRDVNVINNNLED